MEKHSHITAAGHAFWWTEKLWKASEHLEARPVSIDSIAEFNQNCWFRDAPTIHEVADHTKRILAADLSFPIILSADGHLMDGGHRLAKAYLLGLSEITARRFENDPTPDWTE